MGKRLTPSLVLMCVALAALQSHAATYTISVDAASNQGTWSHFYEECIGTCHPITVLRSAFGGRNIQNAMAHGHAECGFRRIRSHNILGDADIYSETASGTPVYNWTLMDSIYDAVVAQGMSAVVEFDGMPPALASGTGKLFCYQTSNPPNMNVTPPKDYNKWRDLCKAFVQHLESRYGATTIRNNWSFEVWNEPDLFLQGTSIPDEYMKMFDYAAEGVRQADSLCKVGGPACSGVHPDMIDRFISHVTSGTNYATGATGSKCDFLSYHRYASDPAYGSSASTVSSPTMMNNYHKAMVDSIVKKYNFKGQIYCTEWAPTSSSEVYHSTDESSGSFIAKTISLLASNDLTQYPLPTAYSFWCLSEIFEENCVGATYYPAYTSGYGICTIGIASNPDSWDLPKPSYTAFRILHKLGTKRVSLAGGTNGDGVGGVATLSANDSSLQVLLYSHVDGAAADPTQSDSVVLTVSNIPFAPGSVKVEYWLMDHTHSNGFRAWQNMGSPGTPSATQWTQLKAAADLTLAEPATTTTLTGKTFTKAFHCNKYSVGLINISNPLATVAHEPLRADRSAGPSISIGKDGIAISMPNTGCTMLKLFDLQGRLALSLNSAGHAGYFRIDRGSLKPGIYLLANEKGMLSTKNPLVVAR